MTDDVAPDPRPDGSHPPEEGGLAGTSGTPAPVDVGRDRRSRRAWTVFVAGPVIFMTHFLVVYLVAEAGCTGGGPFLDRFGPPAPVVVTWVATALAVPACIAAAWRAWRWWRADQLDADPAAGGELHGTELPFIGFLMSVGALIAVLFTAAPVTVLSCTG